MARVTPLTATVIVLESTAPIASVTITLIVVVPAAVVFGAVTTPELLTVTPERAVPSELFTTE